MDGYFKNHLRKTVHQMAKVIKSIQTKVRHTVLFRKLYVDNILKMKLLLTSSTVNIGFVSSQVHSGSRQNIRLKGQDSKWGRLEATLAFFLVLAHESLHLRASSGMSNPSHAYYYPLS